MSRVSTVVLGAMVAGILAGATGCQVEATVKTKTRYTSKEGPSVREGDWQGGQIRINNKAPGTVQNGGVHITYDPNATKVTARAVIIAFGLPEEPADYEATLREAIETFKISQNGTGLNIECLNGTDHNNAKGSESGCERIDIVIPGATPQPLDLYVISGNGGLTMNLGDATIANIETHAFNGDTDASFLDSDGAKVLLIGERSSDVIARVPADLAADRVVLTAEADKVKVEGFPDLVAPFTEVKTVRASGTPGVGMAELNLKSASLSGGDDGLTGTVTLTTR